jgi:hypothetical protein
MGVVEAASGQICNLTNLLTSELFQAHLPFAVVGSIEEVKVGNKTVRARQYPWGVVQGEYLSFCTSFCFFSFQERTTVQESVPSVFGKCQRPMNALLVALLQGHCYIYW